MKAPNFFVGSDLSACPTKESFLKLLCKKIGVNREGISVISWDNSHSQYVIAQLKINGAYPDPEDRVRLILKWFWDDKKHLNGKSNQLLKFVPTNE